MSATILLTVWAGRVTINILPDEVLLDIFLFGRVTDLGPLYRDDSAPYFGKRENVHQLRRHSWRWHRLAHVCRRWRSIVFASPNALDLKLVCGPSTCVELTSIWPPFPVIISDLGGELMPDDYDFDAAIVHPSRVQEINFAHLSRLQFLRFTSATREPLPALTHLRLTVTSGHLFKTALPDGFLGGSAPSLKYLWLRFIAFPTLPKFLLSATDLVHLSVEDTPHAKIISLEVFVTALTVLVNLRSLYIGCGLPLSCLVRGSRPSLQQTRTILPALTCFKFMGSSECSEDLMARIDAPLLDLIWITFYDRRVSDFPQLAQFMRRTTRLKVLDEVHVGLDTNNIEITSSRDATLRSFLNISSGLNISCKPSAWQFSSLARLITSSFPLTHMVDHLYLGPGHSSPQCLPNVEIAEWREIFHPFTAVKNVYIYKEFVKWIVLPLRELILERLTGMLPALESLFLEELPSSGPVQEAIEQLVTARQLLGRPVAVSSWNGS